MATASPNTHDQSLVAFTLDRVLAALALGWVVAAVWQGRTETPVEGTLLLLNGVIGVLFLVRRPAVRRAGLRDAALCLASVPTSALALALSPPPGSWPWPASVLFALAGAGAALSLGTLGTAFGVLPAVRGVVSRGPFRVLRHPVYACELSMVLACTLASQHAWRLFPLALAVVLVVVRVGVEERLLAQLPAYRAYARSVRWRLLPGLW